jgi:hypothetical protein
MPKPQTIHLQRQLERLKNEEDIDMSEEYRLLLEQMRILTDINAVYGEQIKGVTEVVAEMETSRKLLEQKFSQHLDSNEDNNRMLKDIHARIMDPDDGLIVRSREIESRVKTLECAEHEDRVEKKKEEEKKEVETKEEARVRAERRWRIIYIVGFSIMILAVFGKEVAFPLIKFLIMAL